MKINSKQLRQVHRWVGLIFSLSILMSAGSGVLHNVMSRTQSPPPAARPAGFILPRDVRISVADALKHLSNQNVKLQAVSIRSISGEPWYQLFIEGENSHSNGDHCAKRQSGFIKVRAPFTRRIF